MIIDPADPGFSAEETYKSFKLFCAGQVQFADGHVPYWLVCTTRGMALFDGNFSEYNIPARSLIEVWELSGFIKPATLGCGLYGRWWKWT